MERHLDYFEIEGAYGGNQDWFTNIVMHIGGCGAATACDTCIYLALRRGMTGLYPGDVRHLTKQDYKDFSMKMKPYLKPRAGGIDRLETYIEGFQAYLRDLGNEDGKALVMEPLHGEKDVEEAKEAVRREIGQGLPVPCLLLYHRDRKQFGDFTWHWFLLTGYEERGGRFYVTAATYGEASELDFEEMWDTGYEKKGGLVLYSQDEKTKDRQ